MFQAVKQLLRLHSDYRVLMDNLINREAGLKAAGICTWSDWLIVSENQWCFTQARLTRELMIPGLYTLKVNTHCPALYLSYASGKWLFSLTIEDPIPVMDRSASAGI